MDFGKELLYYWRRSEEDNLLKLFQFFFSALILMVFSPIIILIMVAIKIEEPKGKIFYRGKRLGLNGKIFYMYKFRTLKEGSEKKIGKRLLKKNSKYVTFIGKILRKTKLDELPQFINVFLGDMNIIGPRPVRPVMAEKYLEEVPGYTLRFVIKPGLSGLAQVFGDYYTPAAEKLKYELKYIRERNFSYDLRLIYLTLKVVSLRVVDQTIAKYRIQDRFRTYSLRLQKAANFLLTFLAGII